VDGAGGQGEILAIDELGRLIKERREGNRLSVRQAARAADVSFTTLTRVEDGSQPDFVTFMKLCVWLGRPPSSFFRSITERSVDHLEQVVALLGADPRLSPDAADRITAVVRDLYAAFAEAPDPAPVMDVHLRAASIMRPGVPDRLVGVLTDIRRALVERIAEGKL
jgi:transcriptional regulator with XRE-family HTH domain